MYYFLGLERRGSKCLWAKLRWAAGELVHRARGEGERLMARAWLACWHECGVHIIEQQAAVIKEYDYDEEFKHLGYSASLVAARRFFHGDGGHAQNRTPSGERISAQA